MIYIIHLQEKLLTLKYVRDKEWRNYVKGIDGKAIQEKVKVKKDGELYCTRTKTFLQCC
jgi:hypothetical protein